MWKCADPKYECKSTVFLMESALTQLQQVEQKAVGRQRNLGLEDL